MYEAVNSDTDKNEVRKRAKNKQQGHEEGETRHIRFIVIYFFSVHPPQKKFSLVYDGLLFKYYFRIYVFMLFK